LERYKQEFKRAIAAGYPIEEPVRDGLRSFQQSMGLTDKDVARIEQPIIASKQEEYRQRQEKERQRQLKEQQEKARQRQLEKEREVELKSEKGVDYTKLRDLLATGKWKEADKETALLMLKAANRFSEGYLMDSDIDNFPCDDLRTIDQLWVKYSNGKFGFSVQKKIYINELGGTREYNKKIWNQFGDRVGWRTKGLLGMGKEWKSYNDLYYELRDTTPEGHLPACALRVGVGAGGIGNFYMCVGVVVVSSLLSRKEL
jgi:hypothetical protein